MSANPRLDENVARQILEIAHARALPTGHRLTELALAADLQVSRTPVRAALRRLEQQGYVAPAPGRGYALARPVAAIDLAALPEPDSGEALQMRIARDRLTGDLPDAISESDLQRRYDAPRALLARVLGRLAEIGVAERRPGYGWAFLAGIDSPQARRESYAFRLVIEPACLTQPGFALPPDWAAEMRARHATAMQTPWHDTMAVAFYEMNAAFHEGLARASGNRYLRAAVRQQNRLRRFLNIHWTYGRDRVLTNCAEHLGILDRLEEGDRSAAAVLMHRHLEGAARLRPATFPDPERA